MAKQKASKPPPKTAKHAGGRPTKYQPEFAEQAYKFCLLGATDARLAEFLDVSESTISLWKLEHAEFSEALKNGKERADTEVAQALFHRAKGYSHPEDKIFCSDGEPVIVPTIKHYPPDTAAAFIWLKNRAGWRDKQEHEHTGDIHVAIEQH